jgi:hypothetical protein
MRGRGLEITILVAFVVGAGYVFWETRGYPQPPSIAFGGGPSTLPRMLALALVALAVPMAWTVFASPPAARRPHGINVLAQVVLLLALPTVFERAGFVLASSGYIVASMALLMRPRSFAAVGLILAYAVAVSLGIFGLFSTLIGVPLPQRLR